MRRYRRHRGALLIELLVAGILSLLVGAGLVMSLQTTYSSRNTIGSQTLTYAGTRQVIDTLADKLRNAQSYASTSHSVLSAATASDITIYSDTTGNTTRYWLDTSVSPAALKTTVTTGGLATTTTLLSGVSSLQFTYYKNTAASYASPTGYWVTTTNPNAPTDGEKPNVGAVYITATVNINGYSRSIASFLRLRNSPYKSKV